MKKKNRSIISIPFAFLLTILIATPLLAGQSTYAPVAMIRILSFTAIFFAFFYHFKNREKKHIEVSPEGILLLLFVLLPLFYTFLKSPCFYDSLQWSISILAFSAVFILSRDSIKADEKIKLIVAFITLIATGEAISGIIQFMFLNFPRAKGTFFNPNYYGLYLAISAIIIISEFLFSDRKKINKNKSLFKKIFSNYFLTISLLFIITGLLFSASKGVSICFLITLFTMLIFRFKIRGLSLFILIIIVLILIPNPLSDRFEIALHYDIFGFSRLNIWQSALKMFADNPMGIGPAMFKYYFYQYNFPVTNAVSLYGNHAKNSHNEYLQFIAEGGIPGIIIATLLFLFIAIRLYSGIKKKKFILKENNSAGLIFSILLILLHSTVDSSFHDYTSAVMFSLFAGIIAGKTDNPRFSFKISYLFPLIIALTSLSLVIISLILFTGQYYITDGKTANRLSEYEKAEKKLDKSIYLAPIDPSGFNIRANVKVNRYIESDKIEYLQSAFLDESNALLLNRMNPSYPYYCGKILKMIFLKTGNPLHLEKSLFFFKKAQTINPYNPFYRIETSLIYLDARNINDAKKEVERIVQIEPFFLPAYELLYRISEKEDKYDIIYMLAKKIEELDVRKKEIGHLTLYEKSFTKLSEKIKREIAIVDQEREKTQQ